MRSAPESDRSSVASPRARSEYFILAEFLNRATKPGFTGWKRCSGCVLGIWKTVKLHNSLAGTNNPAFHQFILNIFSIL